MPPKTKVATWTKLRKETQALIANWRVRVERAAVAHRHGIERQIRELESKPKEASRSRQVKKLQKKLSGG